MSFNPGDKVLVNFGIEATILAYDEGVDLFSYEVDLGDGSTNRFTEAITQSTIQPLPEGRHAEAVQPELPFPDGEPVAPAAE